MAQSVIRVAGPTGDDVQAAQLGSPDYGPNVPGQDIPSDSTGSVPVGNGYISQSVRVPGIDVLDYPALTFWYHIFTYDIKFSENQQRWFDTLDVRLQGPTGELLTLRDGLPVEQWQEGELADLGWRYAFIPLPRSWAGETITVNIENWNRVDGRLNTWSQIADIRLWEVYRQYLPSLGQTNADASPQPATQRVTTPPLPDNGWR